MSRLPLCPAIAAGSATRFAVYFGDGRANAYALDADTGRELWVRTVDTHPNATITGAPTVHGNRVYVPAWYTPPQPRLCTGATLDGGGAVVVDGMLYVNSGYNGIVGRAGNVLLAFEVR